MSLVMSFVTRTLIGSSTYEALQEAGTWCEDLKNHAKTDKTRWKPLCQLAQSQADAANQIFLVISLVASVVGMIFGSGFLLSFITTSGIVGTLLTLDAKNIISHISQMHQGTDPTFMGQLQKTKTILGRMQVMVQDTLVLKKVPMEWLQDGAIFCGMMEGAPAVCA